MKPSQLVRVASSLFALFLVGPPAPAAEPKAQDDEPGEITRLGGHKGYVFAVVFAPDGKTAVTYGNDFALRRWDLVRQKQIGEWSPGGHHTALAFSGDGKLLASGDHGGALRLWDPTCGRAVGGAVKHADGIGGIAFSPTGKQIACGSKDGVVRVWNVHTGAKELELTHAAAVHSVAFSPDGRFVLFGGEDKAVRLWDLKNDKLGRALEGHTEP